MIDNITVLRCASHYRASKGWRWTAAGWVERKFKPGTFFRATEHHFDGVAELGALLDQARSDPQTYVVSGALTAAGRVPGTIRRRKNGTTPTLAEVPRRWLLLDVDKLPLADRDELATDPDAVIERAIYTLLPPAFHDAACWWHLSGSAWFVPGVLKAHLVFALSEPATNGHIKAVLAQHAPGVDLASILFTLQSEWQH